MRKTKLTLLLLAALFVGVCLGFFGNSAIIKARIRHFSQIPGNLPEHVTQKLTQRLELDAAQQEAVRAIVQSYDSRLQEVREQRRATLDALFVGMRNEIVVHLTPAQSAEYDKVAAEMDRRRHETRALRWAFDLPPPNTGTAPAK